MKLLPDKWSMIVCALKERLKGEVFSDQVTRLVYASDSSIFRVIPQVVVCPRDVGDVAQVVLVARDMGAPITARGAGTSRSGQDLGVGIVLDFGRHMNRIVSVDKEEGVAWVEPGLVAMKLEEALAPDGLFFPPDPSSSRMCTVGGMVGNNAGGPRTLRFGATRDNVDAMELVLSDGSVVELGPEGVMLDGGEGNGKALGRLPSPFDEVAQLLVQRREVIGSHYPTHLLKNSSGYNLRDFPLVEGGFWNPAGLLVGSEGTLGLATQIRLRLRSKPQFRCTLMIMLPDLAAVASAVHACLPHGPSKLELVDRMLLEKGQSAVAGLDRLLRSKFSYLLMAEIWEDSQEEAQAILQCLQNNLVGVETRPVESEEEQAHIWTIRSKSVGYLNRMVGRRRAYPLLEDACVGPERLVDYLQGLHHILSGLNIEGHFHGHAGDGNVHLNTLFDLADRDDLKKAHQLLEEGHALVAQLGGVLSGEHGDGRLRTPFLSSLYSTLHEQIHVPVKKILDPDAILNPGQIVEGPDGEGKTVLANLRFGGEYAHKATGTTLDGTGAMATIESCHGCGECRTYCPVYKAVCREDAAPRSKANLLRELISGALDRGAVALKQGGTRETMELCIGCMACLVDCPSGVDVPGVARLAREVGRQGRFSTLEELALGRPSAMLAMGARTGGLSRAALKSKPLRVLMEYTMGLDRRRKMPVLKRSTLKPRPVLGAVHKRVLFFPGCQGRFQADGGGEAALELLALAGVEAEVPTLPCCGQSAWNLGSRPERSAKRIVQVLKGAVQRGMDVVFSCPSCRLMVTREYGELLGSDQVDFLAGRHHDLMGYLAQSIRLGQLNLPKGSPKTAPSDDVVVVSAETEPAVVTAEADTSKDLSSGGDDGAQDVSLRVVAHHEPCHGRILDMGAGVVQALDGLPGVKVVGLPQGCCGAAGSFGMKRKRYDLSMQIGELKEAAVKASGAMELVSSCASCRMQLFQLTGLPVQHPVDLLFRLLGEEDAVND